jgi:hypothetical protein
MRQPLASGRPDSERHNNAMFIASCAGPAEAGWRATIAAIDLILLDEPLYVGYFHSENELMSFKIVAAWEGLI